MNTFNIDFFVVFLYYLIFGLNVFLFSVLVLVMYLFYIELYLLSINSAFTLTYLL